VSWLFALWIKKVQLLCKNINNASVESIMCTYVIERKYANYIMGWQVVDGI
jgi:hypothetical protein